MARPKRPDPEVPAPEQAHIRHRDRKLETRMVVDNAGVRRLARAVSEKQRQGGKTKKKR